MDLKELLNTAGDRAYALLDEFLAPPADTSSATAAANTSEKPIKELTGADIAEANPLFALHLSKRRRLHRSLHASLTCDLLFNGELYVQLHGDQADSGEALYRGSDLRSGLQATERAAQELRSAGFSGEDRAPHLYELVAQLARIARERRDAALLVSF